MAEEFIKASIVFDDASAKKMMGALSEGGGDERGGKAGGGLFGALSNTLFSQDSPIWGDILSFLGGILQFSKGLMDIAGNMFEWFKNSFPDFSATLGLFQKALVLLLRPIADVMTFFLRPLAIAMLRFVIPIYKQWREFFKGGQAQKAMGEIKSGFGKAVQGFIEVDFKKMWSGFEDVWKGVKDLFGGFFSSVMKPQIDAIFKWWHTAQEKFNTSGIFDTLFAIWKELALGAINFLAHLFGALPQDKAFKSISEALGTLLQAGWNKFMDFIGKSEWKSTGDTFQKVLAGAWDIFGDYLSNLGDSWWAGPLAPFVAAVKTAWEDVVGPMVDSLKKAFEDRFPALAKTMETLFGGQKTSEDESKGFFATLWEAMRSWQAWVLTAILGPAGMLTAIALTFAGVFGSSADDRGNTATGAVNKTSDAMMKSKGQTELLISTLNSIPRNITTTHTIVTKYKTEGKPPK